ncbi:MAG: choice-of-anchor J domain-containing protein [Bacteroidota bacterium]
MKKLKHIWLLTLTMAVMFVSGQSYVEIGTGTVNSPYPAYGNWKYAWCSMLQPQSSIGSAKSITKIAFNFTDANPKTFTNQKIYLKHTALAVFADASYENPTANGYTLVYDGPITFTNGWTELTLTAPFAYNGTDNLIVHYENRYGTAPYGGFAATASTVGNNKSCGSDASFPSASGYLNPYPSAISNIRFYYASTGPATPASPIPAINSEKIDLNVHPSFTLGANTTLYDLYLSTDSSAVASLSNSALVVSNQTVSAAGSFSYTPASILTASSTYFWKVVAKNATQTEASIVWKFTTQNVISTFPYTQGFEGQDVFKDGFYGLYTDWTYPTSGPANMLWSKSSAVNAHSGNFCLYASAPTTPISGSITSPRMILPANHRITFWWINGQLAKTSTKDTTYFEITSNGGQTWVTLETLAPSSAQTAYVNVTKDLSAYAGNNTYIRWRYSKVLSSGSNVYIDDISVEPIPNGSIMELSTTSYAFNPIFNNAQTKTRVIIRNNGTSNLVVTGANTIAPFTCSYTGSIAPGATDTATIIFSGATVGTHNQTLTFANNGTGANSIQLSGEVKALIPSFYETFDAVTVGQLPTNWGKLRSADPYQTLNDVAVKSSSIDAHSAPNVVKMYNNSDTISKLILLTPGVTNFGTNTLKFWASKTWGNTNTVNLVVGLMNDPYDGSSFEPIQTITLADSMESFTINFSATNTKPYIAFKHGENRQMQSIWIDDVEWQGVINQPPTAAAVVFPANDTINIEQQISLKWTSTGGNPTGYKLYLGTNNPPTNMANGIDLGNVLEYSISTDLTYSTQYFWKIVPYNTFGNATTCPVWKFKVMDDPTITVYPWNEGFESITPGTGFNYPLGWKIINNNDAWACWDVIANSAGSPQNAHTGNNAIHTAFTYLNAQNDWLVTPPMLLQGGTTYNFSFWLKSPYYVDSQTQDTTSEKFEVMFGNAPIADSLSVTLYRNESLRMLNYTKISSIVTPTATGKYYVGFHTYSGPLQWLVIIDDVNMSIEQGINEESKNSSVSIYPNPSHGKFSINSSVALENNAMVQITNMIGQNVYNSTLTSNNQLIDANNLTNGMYFVTIINGSTSTTIKIIVQ